VLVIPPPTYILPIRIPNSNHGELPIQVEAKTQSNTPLSISCGNPFSSTKINMHV
jgi:hypothetical protein